MKALSNEVNYLERLYKGRNAYYGDLHNHSNSGGRSDGKCTLSQWQSAMEKLGMDFAAILDHRHVRHMYLPQWEDGVFIGGTEPGTTIVDSKAEMKKIHYNMLFENSAPLEKLLKEFPEYMFEGAPDGQFIYPEFTTARMREIIKFIKDNGGFFVHPHPKQMMVSNDACDYFFEDETGIEVFYGNMRNEDTAQNYKLWCSLLEKGKRVWACAGEDGHAEPTVNALTTLYAEEKSNKAYLSHLRKGDFVCGSVGIRMCIGDCLMGGCCDFNENKLIVSVSDFHKSVKDESHIYKMLLINDKGIALSENILSNKTNYFSFETQMCNFYRVEVIDETENLCIAISNPIWNTKN